LALNSNSQVGCSVDVTTRATCKASPICCHHACVPATAGTGPLCR
jgi:hypothetical protein